MLVKPVDGTWSIAEHLEHLIAFNSSFFPMFQKVIDGQWKTPLLGKMGFLAAWFGDMIYKAALPSNTKKIKTFAIWEPQVSIDADEIIVRFMANQQELMHYYDTLGKAGKLGTVIHSPAGKRVVYPLDKVFKIIAVHEERHIQAAQRVC